MIKKNILRIFCFLLAIMSASSAFCLVISSNEPARDPFFDIVCSYDSKSEKVRIEYRMSSEDVSNYSECLIYVYRLPLGVSPENIDSDEIEPVTEGKKPSNRSDFEITVNSPTERLSSYVLSMQTKNGRVSSDFIVPSVEGCAASSGFKGIESNDILSAADSALKAAVVKVDIDRLDGGTSGYLFSVYGETHIFSRQYVSELDKAIKNYRGTGTVVYLRMISDEFVGGLACDNAASQSRLYAYTSFLLSRYSGEEYGGLAGIILGNGDSSALTTYVKRYAASVYAVGAAAEDAGINCPMIIPTDGNEKIIKSFLTVFCSMSSQYRLPKCTVMLESDRIPFAVKANEEESEVSVEKNSNSGYITADTLATFEHYLKNLSSRTDGIYPSVIYHWDPSLAENAEVLTASYVYNYYKLYFDSSALSYLVCFDGLSGEYADRLSDAVKYTATSLASKYEEDEKILEFLGLSSWKSEIFGFSESKAHSDKLSLKDVEEKPSNNVIGVYEYFDFSSASDISAWYEGGGCDGILSVKNDFGKGLTAKMGLGYNGEGFITHNYKYKESFNYTDRISIEFSFDTLEKEENKYGIRIILGGDGFLCEYSSDGFSPNEKHTVYLDVSSLTEQNEVKYIKIISSGDADNEYKLSLYSMKAESFVYEDEELKNLIEEERERLKSTYGEEKIRRGAVAFVIIVFALTAVVMIIISRKRRTKIRSSEEK